MLFGLVLKQNRYFWNFLCRFKPIRFSMVLKRPRDSESARNWFRPMLFDVVLKLCYESGRID